jgi:dipeptidyl aminopeptidase/acylaminoacyl peptidase
MIREDLSAKIHNLMIRMRKSDLRLPFGDRNDISVWRPNVCDGRVPVIIYSPGYGGGKDLGVGIAFELCSAAVSASMAFVSFTPFGWPETGGEDSEFTYGRWSQNIEDIYHWLCQQSWADPARVGCFAISSGTTTAIRYAQRSSDLKFVISIATCLTIHVGMSDSPVRRSMQELLVEKTGVIPEYFGKKVTGKFYIDSICNAPVFGMNQTKCPIFFLQGTKDNIWRRSDAWIGHEALKRAELPTKYKEIVDGDHSLSEHMREGVTESMNWLREIGILPDSASPRSS